MRTQRGQDLTQRLPFLAEFVSAETGFRVETARQRHGDDHIPRGLVRRAAHAAADDLDHVRRTLARRQDGDRIEGRRVGSFAEDSDVANSLLPVRCPVVREPMQCDAALRRRVTGVQVLDCRFDVGLRQPLRAEVPADLVVRLRAAQPPRHGRRARGSVEKRDRTADPHLAIRGVRSAVEDDSIDQPGQRLAGRQLQLPFSLAALLLVHVPTDAFGCLPSVLVHAECDDPVVGQQVVLDGVLVRASIPLGAEDPLISHVIDRILRAVDALDLLVVGAEDLRRRGLVQPVPGREQRLIVAEREVPDPVGDLLFPDLLDLSRSVRLVADEYLRVALGFPKCLGNVVPRLVRREDQIQAVGSAIAFEKDLDCFGAILRPRQADFDSVCVTGITGRIVARLFLGLDQSSGLVATHGDADRIPLRRAQAPGGRRASPAR